jgi:hypothetical protein
MAFQKSFTHNSGISASYWRVVKVDTNYAMFSGVITLYGYIDQASRDSGNGHLMVKTVYFENAPDDLVFDNWFSISKINGSGKNPIKNAYLYLKQIPDGDFINAIDVIE